MQCILRHMRNCIAHGNFNFIDGKTILGFDYNRHNEITAILQLDILELYKFTEQIKKFSEFTISHLFQYPLLRDSFQIIGYPNPSGEEIIIATSKANGESYYINCSSLLNAKNLDECVEIRGKLNETDGSRTEIYYCEKKQKTIEKIGEKAYVINKDGLAELVQGARLENLIAKVRQIGIKEVRHCDENVVT